MMQNDINEDQIEHIIRIINQCTENFIFMHDLNADTFLISEKALKMFDFPFAKFDNAAEELGRITFKEDGASFKEELEFVKSGKKSELNVDARWLNKIGKPIWISCRGKLMTTNNPYSKVVIGTIDITNESDRADILTGLSTESQLRSDFAFTKIAGDAVSGFMIKLDVDNLGTINEQYGSRTGDLILSRIGECCKKVTSGLGKAYKLASDEFIIMNMTGESALVAKKMYDDLKRELAKTESLLGSDVVFTISGGIIVFANDTSYLEDFHRKLNYTVTLAKEHGRNTILNFDSNQYNNHLRNLKLQDKIRESIKNNFNGFELYYQPVVDAKRIYLDDDETIQNVIGAEALLRWTDNEYGQLMPDDFIPILENTRMIVPVGRWILKTAFNQCMEWNKSQKDFHMSVNVSYIQVQKSDILSDINTALITSKVNPKNITIELTESGYIDNSKALQELTKAISDMGVNVDIDDFGTGYSNLRYLQYLHATTLKLDYTFVHKATHGNEGDNKVIKHITQMAHELNMKVCMEGVESKEDLEKLLNYSPDKFQGFYFGRPVDTTHFKEHYLKPDMKRELYDKKSPSSTNEGIEELPSV